MQDTKKKNQKWQKVYANLALKHVQMDSDHNWKAENMNEE